MFDIFQYDFMLRAFAAGIVVAIIAPLMGNFLVARRYSMLADTLAHVSLVGVAIGVLTQQQPLLVSLITTVVIALLIERLRTSQQISGDSLLALFLSGSLALASVMLTLGARRGGSVSLVSYLFGSIATVSRADLVFISILGCLVVLLAARFYKQLFAVSLNEELAAASGLPVTRINTLLIVLSAVSVALCLRIVGALLIGALIVIPVVTAIQLRRSFVVTVWASLIFSLGATIAGLFLSYYADLPSGGTIVLVLLLFFAAVSLLKK